jgi:hypothetical protein
MLSYLLYLLPLCSSVLSFVSRYKWYPPWQHCLRHDSKVLFADGVVQLKFRLGDHDRLYVINNHYYCSCKCHLDGHYHGKLYVIIARRMTSYRNVLGVTEEGQTRRRFLQPCVFDQELRICMFEKRSTASYCLLYDSHGRRQNFFPRWGRQKIRLQTSA